MSNEEEGTAGVVADLVERLGAPEEIDIANEVAVVEPGQQYANGVLVVPAGKQVVDLRDFENKRLERPRRRQGQSTHTTLASFLEHVERQRDPESAIFATDRIDAASFLAIYDYHEAFERRHYDDGPNGADGKPTVVTRSTLGRPRFGEHRAFYACPFSDEWIGWSSIAGPKAGWLPQLDFAQALEDRGLDVLVPSAIPSKTLEEAQKLSIEPAGPVALMQLSRGLIVRADRKVGAAVNLNSGEAKISFEETHQATVNEAPVLVPSGFVLSIPVFRDGAAYAVICRLRYRVDGARVLWKLAMHRPDAIFRDAFRDVTKEVKERTGLPVFMGSPEGK